MHRFSHYVTLHFFGYLIVSFACMSSNVKKNSETLCAVLICWYCECVL